MFTAIALFAVTGIAWYSQRSTNKEREAVFAHDDDLVRQSVVYAREDLKLMAFLLAAIVVMLGIIADRLG